MIAQIGGGNRQRGRASHIVVGPELTCLQDHLQVCRAAGLFHGDDLVPDSRLIERLPEARHVRVVADEPLPLARDRVDRPGQLGLLREAVDEGGNAAGGAPGPQPAFVSSPRSW